MAKSVYDYQACAEEAVLLIEREARERFAGGWKLSPPQLTTNNQAMSDALRKTLTCPSEEFMEELDRAIARYRYPLCWWFFAKRRMYEIKKGEIHFTR